MHEPFREKRSAMSCFFIEKNHLPRLPNRRRKWDSQGMKSLEQGVRGTASPAFIPSYNKFFLSSSPLFGDR